jgi:hypothetical protein
MCHIIFTQIAIQEYIYDIRNAEHVKESNRYIFRFSEAIRNLDQQLSLGVRSIKMVTAPLEILLRTSIEAEAILDTNGWILKPAANMICDTHMTLNSIESMNDFNLKLDHNTHKLYNTSHDLIMEERYISS